MKKPRNASINTKCCGNSENRKSFFELSLSLIFSLWCLVLLFYSKHGLGHGNGGKWIFFFFYSFCFWVLDSEFVLFYFILFFLDFELTPLSIDGVFVFPLHIPTILLASFGFSGSFSCPFLCFDVLKTHFSLFLCFFSYGKSICCSQGFNFLEE